MTPRLPAWLRLGEASALVRSEDLSPSGGELLCVFPDGSAHPIRVATGNPRLPCGGDSPLDCMVPGDQLLVRYPPEAPEGKGRRERWPILRGDPASIASATLSRLASSGGWAEAVCRDGRTLAARRSPEDPWLPWYDGGAEPQAQPRRAQAEAGGEGAEPPFPFDLM